MANLAGEPALSLPTYLSAANLPLGIQLQGAKGSDQTLLAVGKLFEDHHQFKLLDQQVQQVSSDADQPTTSEEPQPPATPADQTVTDTKQVQTQTEPSQPAAEQPGTTPDEPQIATPVDQPATTGPKSSNDLVSTGQASQPADHKPAIAVSEQPTPTLTDQLATAAQQPERIATKPNRNARGNPCPQTGCPYHWAAAKPYPDPGKRSPLATNREPDQSAGLGPGEPWSLRSP